MNVVVHVYNPELQKLRQEDGQFQALFQKDKKKKKKTATNSGVCLYSRTKEVETRGSL